MTSTAQALLDWIGREPREVAVRAWIAERYPPNMSPAWEHIARDRAEKTVAKQTEPG